MRPSAWARCCSAAASAWSQCTFRTQSRTATYRTLFSVASLVLTVIVLGIIGYIRGRLARLSLLISALEVIVVGAVSGFGGYFLGVWLPKLFGY